MIVKSLIAAALSAGIAFAPAAVQAAPFNPVASVSGDPLVQEVQSRRRRAVRRAYRRGLRRGIRRGDRRGYRRYRRNRRGAVVGGVIGGLALGAIIANSRRGYAEPRRVYRSRFTPAHHGWCSNRYRSYRSSDGTFQPYSGGRRLCVSPYL